MGGSFYNFRNITPKIGHSLTSPQLSIISTPLGNSSPPKKVRKLAIDSGIPSSLRGKVWAWFMSSSMSARVPGLYQQLLAHDKGKWGDAIDRDVAT